MNKRLSLFVGDGQLVPATLQTASQNGWDLQVFALTERDDLSLWQPQSASLSNPLSILLKLRTFSPSHICMVGALSISDKQREGLLGFLRKKKSGKRRTTGDTGMSRLIGALEFTTGAKVIGVHEIVPDLLAAEGLIAGPKINELAFDDCSNALNIAHQIGKLDIGQAVVCVGHRVVGVEDIAGTDALMDRVKEFVKAGKVGNGSAPLVLAKAKKPNQPDTTDLPAIGPQTISNAHKSGIRIVCVEAGKSLIIQKAQTIELAEELEVSLIGIRSDL